MSNYLITYVNCSKGGVTSVIRGRALKYPNHHFDVVFTLDKGGRNAFDDLSNVSVRIISKNKLNKYLQLIIDENDYDEVSVLSMPDVANSLEMNRETRLVYEIHSSAFQVVEREISILNCEKIDEFRVPSNYSAFNIEQLLGRRFSNRVRVVPNLVNTQLFNTQPSNPGRVNLPAGKKPLIWIGRFDKGKGPQYVCRLMAKLPSEYIVIMIVSLETEPERISKVLAEAAALGVADRIFFRLNVSQLEVSELMKSARDAGGSLISTSLQESFGYAIAEAISCNFPVIAFDLPVLEELEGDITKIPTGDVTEMSNKLISRS